MLTEAEIPTRLHPLLRFGDDDSLRGSFEQWRDYVSELELTVDDVPPLLGIVGPWSSHLTAVDEDVPDDAPPEFAWFAPIHAWRALGQLRAVEAVAPMLAQADALDELGDDWALEDWPHVFALIGAAAIDPLEPFAADGGHRRSRFSRLRP